MFKSRFQRWCKLAPTLLTVGVLLFIGWSSWQIATCSHRGVEWSGQNGNVTSIDPDGPAAGLLEVNDRITAINSRPDLFSPMYECAQGSFHITFIRAGVEHSATLQVVPPPLATVLLRELTTLVALTFWGVEPDSLTLSADRRQETALLDFLPDI